MAVTAKRCRITRTQARDWLHIARERKILEPADSTRPAGELTKKGQQLLEAIKARTGKPAKAAVRKKGGRRR